MKELSHQQRLILGSKVKEAVGGHFKLPGYETTNQFFPQHGDGSIDPNTAKQIAEQKISDSIDINSLKLDLTIVRVGDVALYKKLVTEKLSNRNIQEGVTVPAFQKYNKLEDMPHAYIGGPDTGFNEDISLISYSLIAGIFGLSEKERQDWLARYMAKPDKNERLKMLQKIHESSLQNGLFIPIFSGPYTALARSGWKELDTSISGDPQILTNRSHVSASLGSAGVG